MHGLVFTVADSQVYFAFPAHLVLNHGREINTVPLKYFIFSLHLAGFSKEMQGEKMEGSRNAESFLSTRKEMELYWSYNC